MSNYCPGAVQVPQAGGGGLDTSLPPRAVWHITWDALKPDGSQPQFSAVANYLKNQGYCPHIMWNPFTGYIEQYYPASQSARALSAWNGDGAACVQIEVFFTPGCVVDGVKYNTVAETPLKGFDQILDWLDGLGIPRTWPLGSPQWQGNSRDSNTWNSKGGHYGHCNVPDNTHTDPGPMPGLGTPGTLTAQSATITPAKEEGFLMALTDKQQDDIYWMLCSPDGRQYLADLVGGRAAEKTLNTPIKRYGSGLGGETNLAGFLAWNDAHVDAIVNAVSAVAPGADLEAIKGAVREGLASGVNVTATVAVTGEGKSNG